MPKTDALAAFDAAVSGTAVADPLTAFDAAVSAAPPPAPSGPRAEIAARKANPPANAQGDTKETSQFGTMRERAGAVVKGVADFAGVPSRVPQSAGELGEDVVSVTPGLEPWRFLLQSVGAVRGVARAKSEVAAAPTKTGKARAIAAAFPAMGETAAKVMGPAVAQSEGRPVTKEENLDAIRGATTAVTAAALGLMGKRGSNAPAEAVAPPPEAVAPEPAQPMPTASESLPSRDAGEFGEALRTVYTGERDVRVADAAQLADQVRDLVPQPTELEALTVLRDFKHRPEQLEQFENGTHPFYDDVAERARESALERYTKEGKSTQVEAEDAARERGWAERDAAKERVRALQPLIDKVKNPTTEMLAADKMLDEYFGKTLEEAKDLEILKDTFIDPDSGEEVAVNYDPESYITHLLEPKDPRGVRTTDSGGLRFSRMTRYTPFAKRRGYQTVIHALADGVEPRTLNAADSLTIYGDRHGTAVATRTLVNVLRDSHLAKWASSPKRVPDGWSEIGPGTSIFKNEVPYLDSEGKPQIARQSLFAPDDVVDALRPLTDPDYSNTIPGFATTKAYQAYLKAVELGLSVFHIRALNVTAIGNEGFSGLMKSYAAELNSPTFLENERSFIKAGGTTSITGRTFEAYRAAKETVLPSRIDVIRNLPGFKQFDRAAAATSRLTFDIMQRKFKVTDFAIKHAKWIAENPTATPREFAAARRSIAKEVNAAYGGLNWEALGINKLSHSLLKAVFLAPDWTFSNWVNAKTAFSGGPGGTAARAFWFRSAVTGVALTQLTSMLFSGEQSPDPTQVYMGKDAKGKDVLQNIYFAGAPSDLVTMINNVRDFGPLIGTARTIGNKLSPFLRTGTQLVSNTNYMGQPIAVRGAKVSTNIKRTVGHVASQTLPVPFSATNIVQMLTDPKNEYGPEEYVTTILAGTRPRHVPPANERRAQRERAERRAEK